MQGILKSINTLKALIPLYAVYIFSNELSVIISRDYFLASMKFLKNHINYQYKLLSCVSGVDLLGKTYRYSVAYDLLSVTFNNRIRIKTLIAIDALAISVVNIFKNANWWEREVWDMFGIFFQGHPDLRRILTDYGFEGYPLRKDFPLTGFVELRYSDKNKKIIVEPVNLAQEYRLYQFRTPWE